MNNLQYIKQRFGIIGRSKGLEQALDRAVRIANTDFSVIITGESGVGKEVFSKIIHQLSLRKHNKFIAINCGAIPAGTINSELFGHEKGAFTGATNERKGYFEAVDGGTIFLDEIGEMPLDTQAYLLRVLESGEYIRVGSSKTQKTNVRVIAATNVNLEEKIRAGNFREDLYYRLNTIEINVPALKDRREDIYMLFRKFAVDFGEKYRTPAIHLDERAQLILENYSWPGNIRQLKNTAEQLSVLAEERHLNAEQVVQTAPYLLERNLPTISNKTGNKSEPLEEREILYKLLFDMKSDLNDLKSLVFELIRNNDLNVPDVQSLRQLQAPSTARSTPPSFAREVYPPEEKHAFDYVAEENELPDYPNEKPYIISNSEQDSYDQMEVVEESLSLEDMEKDLIKKALKKHSNRRKDAAVDLGISERTLYRKIKQYNL